MSRGAAPWLDDGPEPTAALVGRVRADVVIVGAGFTGLWAALHLTDRDPAIEVVVLEAATVGWLGSGRSGGFLDPSLTHGIANGVTHLPHEITELERLGRANHAELVAFVAEHAIECDLTLPGAVDVATEPWQVEVLAESYALHREHGIDVELLDASAVRARLDSPTYLAGMLNRSVGLVDPGALVRGLARVARERGVRIHEGSPVGSIVRDGRRVRACSRRGEVVADHAILATNAASHRLVRVTGRRFVPVHDYVLMTEPLTAEQLARIGWSGREGFADSGNRFHYYRLTQDDRILWGGYDAIYRFGSRIGPPDDARAPTYALLERNLRATFPQLADVAVERRWNGPIATTTDFLVTFGAVLGGRAHYALGYTGLGVAASRFAARVLADRIQDPSSPLLRLELTTRRPFPFPPEPLRWLAVGLTRRALIRSDERGGRRGPWLRALDRFGIGLDS